MWLNSLIYCTVSRGCRHTYLYVRMLSRVEIIQYDTRVNTGLMEKENISLERIDSNTDGNFVL